MKKTYGKLLLIGLGFFSVTMAWAVYNTFVPIFLDRLLTDTVLIGVIMTVDNMFGVVFQPYFGSMSDRTQTRFGRRIPFLLIGVPIAALGLSLIPLHTGLLSMMAAIILMNFAMSIYRAPVVAMMPDITPENRRSKANGVMNLMGGLGTLIAFTIGGILFDANEFLPFGVCAVIMIVTMIILVTFYKEPPLSQTYNVSSEPDEGLIILKGRKDFFGLMKELMKEHRALLYILVAIFFLFCGYNAIETYLSLYATHVLQITPGDAAFLFAMMAGAFLLFSIPSGLIGEKWGRLNVMMIGLSVITISLFLISLFPVFFVVQILMVINGLAWAMVMINSYPYLVSLAPLNKTGKYTGLYYFFSFFASIVSPIAFGALVDLLDNYGILFFYSKIMFLIAFYLLFKLKTKYDVTTKTIPELPN